METISKTHKVIFGLLLIIFAIGCNGESNSGCNGCSCNCNGCTTRKIIDSENETIRVDGTKIKLTANKVRSTNRKLNLRENSDLITKTTWFTANYNVELDNRPEIKEICEHQINEDQDLEKTISEFNIKFSSDKKHFTVGRIGVVWDFYHLLKIGNPFSSGDYYFVKNKLQYASVPFLKFKEIKWNTFFDTDQLFDTLIIEIGNQNKKYNVNNEEDFLSILSELEPGNKHEMFLINNWYNYMGSRHFTTERVQQIIKVSPEWKKTAITKIFVELNKKDNFQFQGYNNSLLLLLSINDQASLLKADDLLFKNPEFSDDDTHKYFIERYYNKKNPLKAEIRKYIITNAVTTVVKHPESNENFTIDESINIVLAEKDEKSLGIFVDKIKVHKTQDFTDAFFVSDMARQTIDKYDLYSKKIQQQIVKNFTVYIKEVPKDISQFDVQKIYDFLKGKISCKESNQIFEMHKEALKFSKKC